MKRLPRLFALVLLLVLVTLAAVSCGDDDDDDNNDPHGDDDDASDDDAVDDDAADDDAADDDAVDDDTVDDDDDDAVDDDDDDDDDDDADPLTGPADIDGDAGDEYLVVATVPGGGTITSYVVQVRALGDKEPVWERTYDVDGGSMSFQLLDTDGDDTYEIVSTTTFSNAGAYDSRVRIIDGDQGFATTLDTGLVGGVSLYPLGVWDIDDDGRRELLIKGHPDSANTAGGFLKWYESSGSTYTMIKQVDAAPGRYLDALGGWDNGVTKPVNLHGDKGLEYLTIERGLDGGNWSYELRVRRNTDDGARWNKIYPSMRGYMDFRIADLDRDGTWEIVEATNTYDETYTNYTGRVDVRDGDEGYAIGFDTTDQDDVQLVPGVNYDIDADGQPELLLQAYPEPGGVAAGYLAWVEAEADFDQVRRIDLPAGASGYPLTRSRNGLLTPVDIDGDAGLEFAVVSWKSLPDFTVDYTLAVYEQSGATPSWQLTRNFEGGSLSAALSDLDLDGTYEITEVVNYVIVSAKDVALSGRAQVRDGNEGFNLVFQTPVWDNVQVSATGDWDIDRDRAPELLVLTRAPYGGATPAAKWHEGPADYAPIKTIDAPTGATDLRVLGAYR